MAIKLSIDIKDILKYPNLFMIDDLKTARRDLDNIIRQQFNFFRVVNQDTERSAGIFDECFEGSKHSLVDLMTKFYLDGNQAKRGLDNKINFSLVLCTIKMEIETGLHGALEPPDNLLYDE